MAKAKGHPKGSKKKPGKTPDPAAAPTDDFAALLNHHVRTTGITKASLARDIKTTPQYIREIELRIKPPPAMDKVLILAEKLGLTGRDWEVFVAKAREGRTKPESREYIRGLEDTFTKLMNIFDIDFPERRAIREGKFELLHDRIKSAFLEAGKVKNEEDFVPFLHVMRYNEFVKALLSGLENLRQEHSREEVDWVQTEILKQMERMSGIRKAESKMAKRLGRKKK